MRGEKAKAIVHCDVENKVHTMKKGRGGKIEVDILGELYYYCNY